MSTTAAVYPDVAKLLGLAVAARVATLLAGAEFTRVESRDGVRVIIPIDGGRDNLVWPAPRELVHATRLAKGERAAFRVIIEWTRRELEAWIEAGEPYPWPARP